MFKRLHIQLTFFCTSVTSLILIVMTLACLYIAESDASRQSFLAFQNNVSSMFSFLENQSVISHQWLLEMEHTYDFQIKILDNNKEFFFNRLTYSRVSEQRFLDAQQQAKDTYSISASDLGGSGILTQHVEFPLKDHKDYFASVAAIPNGNGILSITILHPLTKEKAQLLRQRYIFTAAALCAVVLFTVFSWLFTKRMMKPLEESRQKQTAFIASASHELRTPLTVILTSLSAMEDAPPDKQQQFSAYIREEGKHMKRLIQDMLSLANADSGNWNLSLAPEDPDTLLLNIYEKYQPVAADRPINWKIALPHEAVSPVILDKERISQVLGILIDNALSYTPIQGTITLSLKIHKEHPVFSVSDSGPGIPDNKKNAVFQRFYRIDESHHDKEHFGLGLCIAEEIIHMHKGKLWIEDTPGGGATFCIRL